MPCTGCNSQLILVQDNFWHLFDHFKTRPLLSHLWNCTAQISLDMHDYDYILLLESWNDEYWLLNAYTSEVLHMNHATFPRGRSVCTMEWNPFWWSVLLLLHKHFTRFFFVKFSTFVAWHLHTYSYFIKTQWHEIKNATLKNISPHCTFKLQ